MTLLMLIYLLHVKPYNDPKLTIQEVFNEITVLLSFYVLFTFTEWVWKQEVRYNLGWVQIGIIGLNLIVNITFMNINPVI